MIMDKARELGIALSESEEYQNYLATKDALDKDESIQMLMEEFRTKQEKLLELLGEESSSNDVISAVNNDLQRAQQTLYSHPLFSDMLSAQSAFQALMSRVNETIGGLIGLPSGSASSGCGGGSCSSCSGCGVH